MASAERAKQLYFPLSEPGQYHLLAPLYPTALVHHWHQHLQEARFSDTTGFRDYPGLAMQSFGGSKPQNISQLNSERGGKAFLLSSLPPTWVSAEIRPVLKLESVFADVFARLKDVRPLVKSLREHLWQHRRPDQNNLEIRERRGELVDDIVEALLQFAANLRKLEPGWSDHRDCKLWREQRRWLDPEANFDQDDLDSSRNWPMDVAKSFGLWLNSVLQTRQTPFGEDELRAWKHEFLPHLERLQQELADE